MRSAADMTGLVRLAAITWVEREKRRTGSRMAAYEVVAQRIGASSSWLRKFVRGHTEAKEPSWTVGWNLLAAYQRVCERVEQAAEAEHARARALERQINAVIESADRLVARMATPPTFGDDDETN